MDAMTGRTAATSRGGEGPQWAESSPSHQNPLHVHAMSLPAPKVIFHLIFSNLLEHATERSKMRADLHVPTLFREPTGTQNLPKSTLNPLSKAT
jgi:hypothetical protein